MRSLCYSNFFFFSEFFFNNEKHNNIYVEFSGDFVLSNELGFEDLRSYIYSQAIDYSSSGWSEVRFNDFIDFSMWLLMWSESQSQNNNCLTNFTLCCLYDSLLNFYRLFTDFVSLGYKSHSNDFLFSTTLLIFFLMHNCFTLISLLVGLLELPSVQLYVLFYTSIFHQSTTPPTVCKYVVLYIDSLLNLINCLGELAIYFRDYRFDLRRICTLWPWTQTIFINLK